MEREQASEIVEKLLKLATDCLDTATKIATENEVGFEWEGPGGLTCTFGNGTWIRLA